MGVFTKMPFLGQNLQKISSWAWFHLGEMAGSHESNDDLEGEPNVADQLDIEERLMWLCLKNESASNGHTAELDRARVIDEAPPETRGFDYAITFPTLIISANFENRANQRKLANPVRYTGMKQSCAPSGDNRKASRWQ